jgi:hypothetical protein
LKDNDLLKALDGTWKLYQGPGTAVGVFIPIPLTRHDPVPVVFKYNPQVDLMTINSADYTEEMLLIPVAQEQQEIAEAILTKDLVTGEVTEKAKTAGSGCDGPTLPILVGTKHYDANYGSPGQYQSISSPFCESRPEDPVTNKLMRDLHYLFRYLTNPLCVTKVDPNDTLDMDMFLLVEFSNSRYGSGKLLFKGNHKDTITIKDGVARSLFSKFADKVDVNFPYFAQAPIVLAR